MKVTLIAHTRVEWNAVLPRLPMSDDHPSPADYLSEFAGRACYESWDRPNPQTASNDSYVRNIVRQQHFSVLEHASATFYVEDVSRTLTHELVRHRHLSFSQRSQRYVDESSSGCVVPDALRDVRNEVLGNGQTVAETFDELQDRANELYQNYVRLMEECGHKKKVARGAARSVLLQNTETNIVVTGNHRAWREMISKRWHVAADPEIRQLAGMLLVKLKGIAPSTYLDFDLQRPVGMLSPDA